MKFIELILAAISGLCGLIAAGCVVKGWDKAAGIPGGIGLFLCNAVWILRLT